MTAWLKKIALGLLALGIAVVLLLVLWYRVDGQPRPETDGYRISSHYHFTEEADGSLVFAPNTPNGHGLLIMHGALIKPMSYARTAAFFARQGYTVYVPRGVFRLSIAAVDSAAARLDSFGVRDWFLIGHSMGGFSGLTLIERHHPDVRAAALWAAAMPGDFTDVRVPLLFLWGDHDGLLPPDRFADARRNLPATTRYETFAGGNHQDFAMYTHQFFDHPGTLGWQAQIDRADEETAAFFAAVSAGETPGP